MIANHHNSLTLAPRSYNAARCEAQAERTLAALTRESAMNEVLLLRLERCRHINKGKE
jgi:hypothetical protein